MPKPVELKPLDNYRLLVRYDDGVEGIADLSDVAGSGVFSLWNNYEAFRNVHIGPFGELSWNDDVEMCADAIYLMITGKPPEDLFPKLRELRHYAGD
jgi:hypothetical protein